MKYVAFLRGINVGGHKKVPMSELKEEFSKSGFLHIKSLLNSGNIVFEAHEEDPKNLEEEIEQVLQKRFGFEIPVIVRNVENLARTAQKNPFKNIEIIKDTRLYVTFLKNFLSHTIVPSEYIRHQDFKVLLVTRGEVFSALSVTKDGLTLKLMEQIEKTFGKNVTTRNWNTIAKVIDIAS